MFGFWLPVGLLIASIGHPAILIAKKRNRITAETYRLIGVIWLVAVVILSIGVGWSSYQMQQTLTRFASVKARADVLQKQIKAAEAQQQLMHFADPLQEADPIAQQKYREVIRKKALSISGESKALTQDLALARSQFDEVKSSPDAPGIYSCPLRARARLDAHPGCRLPRRHSQTARREAHCIAEGIGYRSNAAFRPLVLACVALLAL